MTFANTQRYQWFNMLKPKEVAEAEMDLLTLVAEKGPFDGVLGFSQGSQFAAQVILRHAQLNPFATADERPFRLAIFVNGVTPGDAFKLPAGSKVITPDLASVNGKQALTINGPEIKRTPGVEIMLLPDGRDAIANDGYVYTRYDTEEGGVMIDIPTLHIHCPKDGYETQGLYQICEPSVRKEFLHGHGHSFPRGYKECLEIARLIRATAELAI
jgi:hypothetical protein